METENKKKSKIISMITFFPRMIRIDKHVTEKAQRRTMYALYGILGLIKAIGWSLSATTEYADNTQEFALYIGMALVGFWLLVIGTLGFINTPE